MNNKAGCVFLVGAGCGRMDLITLRGLRRLRQCDVVVYDDLIDSALLDEAPAEAERIYMGKRSGKHAAPQAEISRLLVEKAGEGKRVVRLKGGDPFVFGRGGEEIQALQAAGIPYEEVPGVSSAIAIPAAAGIPVTHRGASRGFHVVTGHTAEKDGLPTDLKALAALDGTLVFLMGLSRLREITAGLMAAGKAPATPAAVLYGGTDRPAVVRGTLADLAERAAQAVSPAVIVVGETAALDFSATLKRPLDGLRVGITGTAAVAAKLRAALEEQGAAVETVVSSVVEALPLNLEALCDGGTHWLVFTSANGVRVFFRYLREQRIDIRRLSRCKFAVIGAATGKELEECGIRPELCPETYTSAALAAALLKQVKSGEDVVLLRSREGSRELAQTLIDGKIPLWDMPLYTLRADPRTAGRGRQALPELDYLTFSSGSGVEMFFRSCPAIPERTVCVCIGEVTARALQKRYDRPFLTAERISTEGIVETILRHRAEDGQ